MQKLYKHQNMQKFKKILKKKIYSIKKYKMVSQATQYDENDFIGLKVVPSAPPVNDQSFNSEVGME